MTARTVKVSDSEPFQSAAIRGVSGNLKHLKKHTSVKQNAKNAETRMACVMRSPTNVSEKTNVLNYEDTAILRSSRPRSGSPPSFLLTSMYQLPRLIWQLG
eukprot:6201242-Pleurochrysis_carterae.AAC.3